MNHVRSTINDAIRELRQELQDYIEATYHLSNPRLVAQRRRLLMQPGIIHQRPYLESTPRYRLARPFSELDLDMPVLEAYSAVSESEADLHVRIHDPPYQHQAESIQMSLLKERSLMVMTGTGSGKTECFLLPILGKLAREAANKSSTSFKDHNAMRAMVLYPMNALVNDQLGRLRLLFGDRRITKKFIEWSDRPARFARYTSRTPYPGVRTKSKDQIRLKAIGEYYVDTLQTSQQTQSHKQEAAASLVRELKKRGKWPAKPDLVGWYGEKGSQWSDPNTGKFQRCVTLPSDPELVTRHEVQAAPPDILVTNYSMLEYMLMRPLERPIFDYTRDWLKANPSEKFLLVIDEAHLYRGAAGAEVALLIRRLRTRLEISPSRLQIICTSASFHDPEKAVKFGAQLTGKDPGNFHPVVGELLRKTHQADQRHVTLREAKVLAAIKLQSFYDANSDDTRLACLQPFLKCRGVSSHPTLQHALYDALASFPPMVKLINCTMTKAWPIKDLGMELFDELPPEVVDRATTNLIALGSMAKRRSDEPSLLPCRIHSFYRGLAGLWVCMDPDCGSLSLDERGNSTGMLFGQPRHRCDCGACVLELYSCRNCGAAYGRAYTDDVDNPDYLWSEAGRSFRTHSGQVDELAPIDLFLEQPVFVHEVEPADYDLVTGRLNPENLGQRNRQVFLRNNRSAPLEANGETSNVAPGQFRPCAVCGQKAAFGRSSVQDHQTNGDQPFQALIAKQIQIQPPSPVEATEFAPLRGRKVLVFSDSRQTAARLAPNLQTNLTQDALRPLIVAGYARLTQSPIANHLGLYDVYLAVLVAAKELGVRLRPELRNDEDFRAQRIVAEAVENGALENDDERLLDLFVEIRSCRPPESLFRAIINLLTDRYYGLESLALASLVERPKHTPTLRELPDVPGVAESEGTKVALARVWLRCWLDRRLRFWLAHHMPSAWQSSYVRSHSGKFHSMSRFLRDTTAKRTFKNKWIPQLLRLLAEPIAGKFRLRGGELALEVGGTWAYCQSCRSVQRPFPERMTCVVCGQEKAKIIDPDMDPVFIARKGYYRASTVKAMTNPPEPPMALIAAEHTAQLNTAQYAEVFSKAEEHELLFQDVDLGPDDSGRSRPAVDILSCTTTMEVGIDIGSLTGVSLRNMPPARANYQQRAGRAGRRGNAVATVTAFGSADSHDEQYFTQPDQMIRGKVDDPSLTLDNREITRRHVTAYLLQRYHQERLPQIQPESQPHLFEVLGTVADFKNPQKPLNRVDLERWLRSNQNELRAEVSSWLPNEISTSDRQCILESLIPETLKLIDRVIGYEPENEGAKYGGNTEEGDDGIPLEMLYEVGEETPRQKLASGNLLDRLLYEGVLPRYAFPTDVAAFHVFDRERSSSYQPVFRFTPSQSLGVALSQYAPGKQVWIGHKLWTSGAIYSPIRGDRSRAWDSRRFYYECRDCGYAKTVPLDIDLHDEERDCEACGGDGTMGPARQWLRPPGFAHPVFQEEGTSPDDQPARSYATRAKLTMDTPPRDSRWKKVNSSIRMYWTREHLLITNRGPRKEGYTYCTKCGLIEPTASLNGTVESAHKKPFPDSLDEKCPGGGTTHGIVLGTDFISDVLLISIAVEPPITVAPHHLATNVALRTLSEALAKAACKLLELEAKELQAEFRPALTPRGRKGREAEIYLYDTLPGGAGFSQRVGQLGMEVFDHALDIMEKCPDDCDQSCYRCLRSYKNKFEHDLLDRHLGASLLRCILRNTPPVLDRNRIEQSTKMLFDDIHGKDVKGVTLDLEKSVTVTGLGVFVAPIYVSRDGKEDFIISLHNPLTRDDPCDQGLRTLMEDSVTIPVHLVDEILVRLNLQSATNSVLERLRQH